MWKLVNVQDQDYLVNFKADHSLVKILISNFENLWSAELNEKKLIDTFKICNPVIELDRKTLIKEIEYIFTKDTKNVSWNIHIIPDQLKLNLSSKFGNVPFKFEIDFSMVDNKILFQTIVSPLLMLLKGMQKQNEYLCNIIQKKDREIAEYQLDGAVLSRKTVETPMFDDTVLNNVLDENLKIISKEKVGSFFDEKFSLYLDKIDTLLCEQKTTEGENKCLELESEKHETSIQEPATKKFVETVSENEKTEKKSTRLEKPTIKKKPKIVKSRLNL